MAHGCTHARRAERRGFTLIELIAVLSLIAVMSLAATPALRTIGTARQNALARDVERRMQHIRSYAIAAARPAGLAFDTDAQTVTMVEIIDDGLAPTTANPFVTDQPQLVINSTFAGSSIATVDIHPGRPYDTVWFDPNGIPHVRDDAGDFVTTLLQDAVITFDGGRTVTVRRSTGLVER